MKFHTFTFTIKLTFQIEKEDVGNVFECECKYIKKLNHYNKSSSLYNY